MTSVIRNAVIRAYKGGHRDVANVFFLMFSPFFNVVVKNGLTTIHKRESLDEPFKKSHVVFIRRHLSNEVANMFNKTAKVCFEKAFNEQGDLIKPKHIEIANSLLSVGALLNNATYKNHVTREILELFINMES